MIDSPSPGARRRPRLLLPGEPAEGLGQEPVREPGSLVEHVELQPPGILDSEQRDRPAPWRSEFSTAFKSACSR